MRDDERAAIPRIGKGRRLLIVEADSPIRGLLELQLHLVGFAVEMAADALHGLQLAKTLRPDAIICDVRLPGITGFGFCGALRTDPDIKHLLMTKAGFVVTTRRP